MRLSYILNESSPTEDVGGILAALTDKQLIVFGIKTTSTKPRDEFNQVIGIAAIVVDAGTGQEIDAFNEEAALSLSTLRQMDLQDRKAKAGEWPEGEYRIRDMLNAFDYDIEAYESGEETNKPDEIEVLLSFKSFIDKYAGQAVLVAHNAQSAMHHLNTRLPTPIKGVPVVDTLDLTNRYFVPLLQTLVVNGYKKAQEMGDQLWGDDGKPDLSLRNLAAALKVPIAKWHAATSYEQVRQLAGVLRKMIQFIQKNIEAFSDEDYLQFAK